LLADHDDCQLNAELVETSGRIAQVVAELGESASGWLSWVAEKLALEKIKIRCR
jgi:hypothetical protein